MTDRDKLIELIVQANELCSNKDCAECEYLNNDRILCDTYNIADYLLANGIIVPPCKVGDTVYQTDGVRIYEGTIKKIIYDAHNISFDETAIGKTVFLTKEEAEAKLREMG